MEVAAAGMWGPGRFFFFFQDDRNSERVSCCRGRSGGDLGGSGREERRCWPRTLWDHCRSEARQEGTDTDGPTGPRGFAPPGQCSSVDPKSRGQEGAVPCRGGRSPEPPRPASRGSVSVCGHSWPSLGSAQRSSLFCCREGKCVRQPVEAGEPVCLGGRKSSPEGGTRDGATGGKDQPRSPCARRLLPSLHVGLWGHSLSRTSFPKKQPAEAWGRGPDRVCHASRVVKTALRRRALVRPARAGASPGSAPCGRGRGWGVQ